MYIVNVHVSAGDEDDGSEQLRALAGVVHHDLHPVLRDDDCAHGHVEVWPGPLLQ